LDEGRSFLVKDPTPALFLTTQGNRMHNVALLRVLRRLAKAARIRKTVTPHLMRRTFATHLLQNKTSLKVIQALLGHANLATTSVYLRLDTSELRRELLLRHPRERFDA
jgi:integrase/recombinase XerD